MLWREDWKKLQYSRDVVRFVEHEMYVGTSQTSVQAIAILVEREESVITFIEEDSMFGGAYGDARMPNWPH